MTSRIVSADRSTIRKRNKSRHDRRAEKSGCSFRQYAGAGRICRRARQAEGQMTEDKITSQFLAYELRSALCGLKI